MRLSEPVSGSHVATATGAVPLNIPPPPYCSSPVPLLHSNPATVHPLPSQIIPKPTPDPAPSAVLSPDPQPPPPPQPLPSSFQASGAPPATSDPVLIPSIAPNHPHLPGHNLGPSSATAQPPPPPPTPVPLPHLPLPTPSVPLSRQPRPSATSAPQGSAPPPQQLSYAQAAKHSRGPSFVRAHAIEVEPFARIPRTGANIICGSREGIPSFSFVSSDLPKVEEIYSNALVMKFSGGRPSLEASHKEIYSWGMEKSFSIGPLSSRAFLLRFQDNRDLLKVLTRPSSLLITFPYKVFRWHNLCHIKEDSCLAPVWISLPRLPLQCFIPEFLESVGNKLGRFLCFDKATTTLARPSAARICVELDLRKSQPQFIWIGLFEGFKQEIIYERLPKFCNHCHMMGHSTAMCSKICTEAQTTPTGRRKSIHSVSPPPARRYAEHLAGSSFRAPATTSVRPPPARRYAKHVAGSSSQAVATPSTQSISPQSTTEGGERSTIIAPLSEQNPVSVPPPSASGAVSSSLSASSAIPQTPFMHSLKPISSSDDTPHVQQSSTAPVPLYPTSAAAPSLLTRKSILRKGKKKKKSVSFNLPGQTNLSANREFWNVVSSQVAMLDHRPPSQAATPFPVPQVEGEIHSSSSSMPLPQSEHSSDESSGSSIAADSPPPSPRALAMQSRPVSYASEGEEATTELSPMLGHSTDELLGGKTLHSKRNKRHPDQPLKVQLRVRKDPNPTTQ